VTDIFYIYKSMKLALENRNITINETNSQLF